MSERAETISLDEYFAACDRESRDLFESARAAIESVGPSEMRVTKSQISFRRRVGFAWTWIPGQYLSGDLPPLVLTVGLRRRDGSPRWKQVVEPSPGRYVHHLEIRSAKELDSEVVEWLREAWEGAG